MMYNNRKSRKGEIGVNAESVLRLDGAKKRAWQDFLARAGLEPDENREQTVLVWDDDTLIATGSRQENLLKCIAVDPARQGEGLLASVLTALRQEAFQNGYRHLFLYTKPQNEYLFRSLFFYPVAKTEDVLLMEDSKDGIGRFLDTLTVNVQGKVVGAAVMNCDPFTLGHQYLIETAAAECDQVYVFVLSEDKSTYSSADRMEMVKAGTAHLPNVTVLPTGPYLISEATFPKYFLKDRETAQREHYVLDLAVFTRWFVPHFGITHRYAGSEPTCVVTEGYNRAMEALLPEAGVSFLQVPRREMEGAAISASIVRKEGSEARLKKLVPRSTWELMVKKNYFKGE
jgi:[citrate (pro-3S)-lyase] ligase